MLAVARWMFGLGAETVRLHPDGMHARQFDIYEWLTSQGFKKITSMGTTPHGGNYARGQKMLEVEFKPGQGDVVAEIEGRRVVVEAKGGIINTRHPGQKSRLRKHLYEAVGMLLDGPDRSDRLIAAVPLHPETKKIARRMASRCRDIGVEIALVSGAGEIQMVAEEAKD